MRTGEKAQIRVAFSGTKVVHTIQQRVQAVQIRLQRQRLWQCASAGLLVGGISGCVLALARIITQNAFSWIWIAVCICVPVLAGVISAFVRSCSLQSAAGHIDQKCNLKDRAQTALQFLDASPLDSMRRLQIEDAEAHLRSADPVRIAPMHAPEFWSWGIITSVAAMLIAVLSNFPKPLMASVATNSVVAEQAERAAKGLEELEQFQQTQNDPELEKLLKEMNQQLQEMKLPGIDPKEALAKLSEMEAALQEMQQQLSVPVGEARLREIGDTLSLAEAMSSAGQAMSKGDMEKAAKELSGMDMPELDRKTEKAITEKLEQLEKKAAEEGKTNRLQESLKKMRKGMSTGDKSQFQEGAKDLAGECRKQGQKQKLSDLLKKQSQCLGECKSECEGECKAQAQGPNKGGNKAGAGSGGAPAGEKTAGKKTGQELKITGQDSGTGDVDTETTTDPEPEQEQEAVRQYRQQADKYEALRESALESESIPAGQRQIIRRYFEMIRPQGNETEAVRERTE